ncbi:MAG TPA: lysylphosphatidylglycerol synthase transmembrane domain-containing protein [Candidatus Binataceae bacterium]|nr:lysylphosphatidylglycerol synthase transmembrane domain-containing protein [Candidatus Binataceae bacterium]
MPASGNVPALNRPDPGSTRAEAILADRKANSHRLRPSLVFVAKLAAGIGLVGFLLWHYDLTSAFQLMRHERPLLFVATVALYVGGQLMSAFRWQLLGAIVGLPGRYSEYVAYYFIGMFTNVFVPGLVGGDALRALYLGRRHQRIGPAFASVIADRGVGLLALFWLAAVAALVATSAHLPSSILQATLTAGLASMLLYCAAPLLARWLTRNHRIGQWLAPAIPYLSQPLALVPAIALSLLLQISLAFCQYLLGIGLGLDIALTTFVLVVPITNVIASLPVTINGLGMREAGYLVLLGMAGVSKDQAIALSILYFAATLAGGFTGIIAFVTTPIPASANERSLALSSEN